MTYYYPSALPQSVCSEAFMFLLVAVSTLKSLSCVAWATQHIPVYIKWDGIPNHVINRCYYIPFNRLPSSRLNKILANLLRAYWPLWNMNESFPSGFKSSRSRLAMTWAYEDTVTTREGAESTSWSIRRWVNRKWPVNKDHCKGKIRAGNKDWKYFGNNLQHRKGTTRVQRRYMYARFSLLPTIGTLRVQKCLFLQIPSISTKEGKPKGKSSYTGR